MSTYRTYGDNRTVYDPTQWTLIQDTQIQNIRNIRSDDWYWNVYIPKTFIPDMDTDLIRSCIEKAEKEYNSAVLAVYLPYIHLYDTLQSRGESIVREWDK
jgi:hypothetical protein